MTSLGFPRIPGAPSGDALIDPADKGPGEVGPGESAPEGWSHRCAACGASYREGESHACPEGRAATGDLLVGVAERALENVVMSFEMSGAVSESAVAVARAALDTIRAQR